MNGHARRSFGTAQNLDDGTLQKTSNMTTSIGNIIATVGTLERVGDPVLQLRNKGVLNQVVDYCKAIEATYFALSSPLSGG